MERTDVFDLMGELKLYGMRLAYDEVMATGEFLTSQRNTVLIGGTGTGKSHLAIAIARACISKGTRGRFYNVVDLVNRLEAEARSGRQGRLADSLARLDFIVFDELGYLPFAQAGGQLLFHLVSRLYERTSIIVTTNPAFGEWSRQFPEGSLTITGIRVHSYLKSCAICVQQGNETSIKGGKSRDKNRTRSHLSA